MTIKPGARGQRHAQRGEHQRRGALQRVLPGEPVAERALEQRGPHLHRVDPGKGHHQAEQQQRRRDGEHRQGEFLECVAHDGGAARVQTEPTTPSTR
jgi:hypothetical protein